MTLQKGSKKLSELCCTVSKTITSNFASAKKNKHEKQKLFKNIQ